MPFQNPLFTVDSALFTVHENALKVLMVKRAEAPFLGQWALPGGFIDVEQDANTDATAQRKLRDKTGFSPQYLEQLQVISGAQRDPRGYSVTLAYYALAAHAPVRPQIASVAIAQWLDVKTLPSDIAFDHANIIALAHQRLQQKTLYSMIPVFCLPEKFMIAQLKQVIETIIEQPLQRKSLMRRIEVSGMFEIHEEKASSGGRLAQLYSVKAGADLINFQRNLSLNTSNE